MPKRKMYWNHDWMGGWEFWDPNDEAEDGNFSPMRCDEIEIPQELIDEYKAAQENYAAFNAKIREMVQAQNPRKK